MSTTLTPTLSAEETARRGDALYEQLRPVLEGAHDGQIAAVDVLTGNYATGETALIAARALRETHPDAEVWLVRVGDRALHRIGSNLTPQEAGGMTVNERLFAANLSGAFDEAAMQRDKTTAARILDRVFVSPADAEAILAQVFRAGSQ